MTDDDLSRARASVRTCGLNVGDWWQHAARGTTYVIVLLTLDEATLAPLAHYRDILTPDEVPWSRPAADFQALVEVDGAVRPRFTRVGPYATIAAVEHRPIVDTPVTHIVRCTCGWQPHALQDSDTAFAVHRAFVTIEAQQKAKET